MPAHRSALLDDVPVKMLRARGEPVPKNLRELRREHGEVLRDAAVIAGYAKRHKELAAELDVTESQLSEWFAGTENPQTFRFERHPVLGPALLIAQGRAREGDGVTVTTQIAVQLPAKAPMRTA